MVKRHSKNSGFTLIELIVTVAILAIVSTGMILSLNIVFSANSRKSAKSCQAVLDRCRINAMARSGTDTFVAFYNDSNGKATASYILNNKVIETDTLCNIKVKGSFEGKPSISGADLKGDLSEDKMLYVSFNRSNGSLKGFALGSPYTVEADGKVKLPSDMTTTSLSNYTNTADAKIFFSGSNRYAVTIDPLTGNISYGST